MPSIDTLYRLWQLIGVSLLIALIWVSLTPSPPDAASPLSWDKANHLIGYGLLTGWLGQLSLRSRYRWQLALALLLLGGGLELLQGVGGLRQPEWGDLLANSLGILLAWWLLQRTPLGHTLIWLQQQLRRRR